MDKRGEYQKFPSKTFCLTVPKSFAGGPFTNALISGFKKVWIRGKKRGGGVSRFSLEIFLSHSAQKLRTKSFIVALILGTEKSLDKRGGEYQDFPSTDFCLTVPKNFVGETFTVALFSGSQKVGIGGGYQDFPSKTFCLTVTKNFVGEPFSVSLISSIQKFYASEGYVTIFDFLSKFFCLTVPK